MAEAQAINFGTQVKPGADWDASPQPAAAPAQQQFPGRGIPPQPSKPAALKRALNLTPGAPKVPLATGAPPAPAAAAPTQSLEQISQDPSQALAGADPAKMLQTSVQMGLRAGDEESFAKKQQAENAVKWQKENTRLSEKMVEDANNAMEARKRDIQEASPFAPTKESAQDLASIFSLLSIAAFGSGGKGKYAGMQALAGMTGAMKGYKEGQKTIYDKEVKKFEENLQSIKSHNDKVEKLYHDAMDLMSKNKDLGEQKIKELQAIDNTGIIAQLARAHKYQQVGEAIKTVSDALQKTKDKADALKQKHADKAAEWAHEERRDAARFAKEIALYDRKHAAGPSLSNMTPQDSFKFNVDGIASYAINPKDFPIKERGQLLAAARQVNPSYQEGDYGNRTMAYRNWVNPNGMGAKQITAFNTVANHLSTLQELGDAMNNKNIPLQNFALNWFSKAGGHPEVTNFDSAKQAVAAEMVKAITGTAGALQDREEAQQIFSAVKSPEQLSGAISTIKKLINGRLETSRQIYEAGTGRKDFEQLLSPIVKQEFLGSHSSKSEKDSKVKATPEEIKTYADAYYGGDRKKAEDDLRKKGHL